MDTFSMKGRRGARFGACRIWMVLAAACSLAVAAPVRADDDERTPRACTWTARTVLGACHAEVHDDYLIAKANCINVGDDAERRTCREEARSERAETEELCGEQFDARRAVCDLVGEDRYDPDWDPAAFVDPREIGASVAPNAYFPLRAGNRWVYMGTFENEDGETVTEKITVTVTERTKLIEGVRCRVVNDLVEVNGVKKEDTDDWYAQDLQGRVWYCGEEVKDFESFEGDEPQLPELVAIDGSFKVGRDGAKPGIIMLAAPQVGDAYRQEVSLGNAEDYAQVINTTASEAVPAASCSGDCLVIREGTPIEPGVFADKYYAPGVGAILEVENGNRVELTEFHPAP